MARRALLRSALVAAPATLAAACGIGKQGETDARPAAGVPQGKVEMWQIYAGSPALPDVKAVIQRKLPKVDVQISEAATNADIPQKLTVTVAGGTPPDAVYINAPFWRDCARYFQPLDALIKRDAKQIDADDFLPMGTQASAVKGKVYGLPLEIACRVWWFNNSLFTEKGVPTPVRAGAPNKVDYKTMEELAQRLTFTKGDAQIYGLFVIRTWFDILIYVSGFGGKFLDADHTKCLLDSPQATAGMEYAFELCDKRRVAPATGGIDQYQQDNTVAMALANSARAQNLRKMPQGAAWDVGPIVQGPAAPMTYAFVHHGGVVNGSKNPDAAWAVLSEFTGKDVNRYWMVGHGWPTARKSYLDTWVKEGEAPPVTRQNVIEWIKQSPLVTFPVGYNGTIAPVATRLVNEAINGQRSVRDTTATMAREITNLLEKS